jgi:hypothetical protein
MASTLSSTQAYPHHEGDVVPLAPKDWAGAEEALSRLAHNAARNASDRPTCMTGSDFSAGLRVTEPPFEATLRPAAVDNDQVPSDRPSLGRRAVRSFARFLLAVCIGVAATLAWQSYGEAAKQMIASWAPQLGWSSSLPVTNPSPGPEIAAKQPSPRAVQAAAADAAPAQPASLDQIAPAAPSPEAVQQLARDLATVREGVEQLTASQEQMAGNIAKLQAAEQDIRHKISAPPPRPAPAPARKPVTSLPPPQAAPQLSSTPPPPALPPPPSRPPMPLR